MKLAITAMALPSVLLLTCSSAAARNSDASNGSGRVPRPRVSGGRSEPQFVWVALEGAGKVAKVNVTTRRVRRRFDVPGAPHNLTVGAKGAVATTLPAAGRLAIIRRGRVRSIYLGGSPHDVKIVRGIAVVANEGRARLNRVSVRKARWRRGIRLKANPHDLAISPGGRRAWVTLDGTDDIAIVNLVRRRVRRYLSTGKSPHDVLFSPHGRRVWVTDWNGSVHVFSKKGRLVKSINRGVELHHLAFARGGREVWVTDGGGDRVFVISARALRVVAKGRIRGSPHHVALTRNGRKVVVADHDRDKLVVFDVATRRRLRPIRVGQEPHGVWTGR